MLVRQSTHEIQISKKNQVLYEKKQQREYTIKRKVYNFSQILDDEDEKESRIERKPIESHQEKRGLNIEQTQQEGKEEKLCSIDKSQMVRNIREKSLANLSQSSERIEKKQSYCLLKCLGVTLIILILMTIFQEYAPNSHFNLLRFLKSPYGERSVSQETNQNVNNDI